MFHFEGAPTDKGLFRNVRPSSKSYHRTVDTQAELTAAVTVAWKDNAKDDTQHSVYDAVVIYVFGAGGHSTYRFPVVDGKVQWERPRVATHGVQPSR